MSVGEERLCLTAREGQRFAGGVGWLGIGMGCHGAVLVGKLRWPMLLSAWYQYLEDLVGRGGVVACCRELPDIRWNGGEGKVG